MAWRRTGDKPLSKANVGTCLLHWHIYMRHSPQLVINGLAPDCGISIDNALGAVSVYRCYFTNTGIPIIKIRRPHARLYNGSQLETASLNCIRGPLPYKKISFYYHSNENPYTSKTVSLHWIESLGIIPQSCAKPSVWCWVNWTVIHDWLFSVSFSFCLAISADAADGMPLKTRSGGMINPLAPVTPFINLD